MTKHYKSAFPFLIDYMDDGVVVLQAAYKEVMDKYGALTDLGLFFHIVMGVKLQEVDSVILIEGCFAESRIGAIPVFNNIIVSDEGFTDEMMDRSNELDKKEGYQSIKN